MQQKLINKLHSLSQIKLMVVGGDGLGRASSSGFPSNFNIYFQPHIEKLIFSEEALKLLVLMFVKGMVTVVGIIYQCRLLAYDRVTRPGYVGIFVTLKSRLYSYEKEQQRATSFSLLNCILPSRPYTVEASFVQNCPYYVIAENKPKPKKSTRFRAPVSKASCSPQEGASV